MIKALMPRCAWCGAYRVSPDPLAGHDLTLHSITCLATAATQPHALVNDAGDVFYPDDDEDRRWFVEAEGAYPFSSLADRRCCDMHNEHCEPSSELCCGDCTEVHHGLHGCGLPGFGLSHDDGSRCVLDSSLTP